MCVCVCVHVCERGGLHGGCLSMLVGRCSLLDG